MIPHVAVKAGELYEAEILGFTLKDSGNSNPMIVVNLLLDIGEEVAVYLVITANAESAAKGAPSLMKLLRVCGEHKVADSLRAKLNPSFELDTLIGRKIGARCDRAGFFNIEPI